MSYILDALKKAESERNSGTAPQLHAQHSTVVAPLDDESPSRTKAWIRFGLTAVAAVLLALVWLKLRPAAPPAAPPIVATAPPPAQQVAATADPAPPVATGQPSSPAPIAPPASDAAAPPPEAPAKPAKQKVRPAKAAAPAESKPAETAAPAAENRIAALRELPQHIQNEIPALTISGYIYSQNKSDRTVLINKRLLHEGDQVAPDLTLEKLTPTGMVLNYKGYRYRTSY